VFNGKADQLAFIAFNDEDELAIKKQFGLENAEWVEDHVLARGEVRGLPGENKAKLLFNYDLGIELEILRYLEGPNYAEWLQGGSMCHVGFHYDPAKGDGSVPTFDAPIIQRVETVSHTNQYLLDNGRKYRYTIYNTLSTLGVFTKIIERIHG
jgi:hypothetical protein